MIEPGPSRAGGSVDFEILSGSADPTDPPSTTAAIFTRTDVVRALYWNGAAWVVMISEV
jgi:hypothetical protein